MVRTSRVLRARRHRQHLRPAGDLLQDPAGKPNPPPSAGLQFFDQVRIDGESEATTGPLKDVENRALYSVPLEAAEAT